MTDLSLGLWKNDYDRQQTFVPVVFIRESSWFLRIGSSVRVLFFSKYKDVKQFSVGDIFKKDRVQFLLRSEVKGEASTGKWPVECCATF